MWMVSPDSVHVLCVLTTYHSSLLDEEVDEIEIPRGPFIPSSDAKEVDAESEDLSDSSSDSEDE